MSKKRVQRLGQVAVIVGLLSFIALGAGALSNPVQFYRSYLFGFLFWLGFPLGALNLLAIFYLTGGRWGDVIRPALEAAIGTLWLMALLFIPILFGLAEIFSWARPNVVAENAKLVHKAFYLNKIFFVVRGALYFTAWLFAAKILNSKNQQIKTTLSGPLLVICCVSVSFAAIDWIMSLEPEWYSTIFGLNVLASHGLSAVGLGILSCTLRTEPLDAKTSRDLGGILLTFVMLWAYLSFMQFLIMWSGNLPEEVIWFKHRTQGGWQILAILFIVFQFVAPFYMLLFRAVKSRLIVLSGVVVVCLLAHLANTYWIVMPSFSSEQFVLHWQSVVALCAIGGIWFGLLVRNLTTKFEALNAS